MWFFWGMRVLLGKSKVEGVLWVFGESVVWGGYCTGKGFGVRGCLVCRRNKGAWLE